MERQAKFERQMGGVGGLAREHGGLPVRFREEPHLFGGRRGASRDKISTLAIIAGIDFAKTGGEIRISGCARGDGTVNIKRRDCSRAVMSAVAPRMMRP